MNQPIRQFASFREFYPFYLSEHANPACRRLHFAGTSLVFTIGFLIGTLGGVGDTSAVVTTPVPTVRS